MLVSSSESEVKYGIPPYRPVQLQTRRHGEATARGNGCPEDNEGYSGGNIYRDRSADPASAGQRQNPLSLG